MHSHGFRISGYRIITGRILTHSHQHRCLLYFQIFGFTAEISRRGCLYTDSIIQEVELIKIHCQNLFFRIVTFQFYGNHPFDRLLEQTFHHIVSTGGIKLLGKLLGDGTATAGILLHQDTALHYGTRQGVGIQCPNVRQNVHLP